MRSCATVLLLVIALHQFAAQGAQTAVARVFCFSTRFSQGVEPIWDSTLDLSTTASPFNGELAPSDDPNYGYQSYITMYNELYFYEPVTGSMLLNLPEFVDVNGDGFDDFFDTTCSVSGTSQGTYNFPGWGPGTISAAWSRPAGSKNGTCVLNLQHFGSYTHSFELLEYRGTVSYTPGTTSVSGTLAVARTGAASETLGGALQWTKNASRPEDWLDLLSGTLTNQAGQSLPYFEWDFSRDPRWPTNYYGYVEFQDGNPVTQAEDYYWWLLLIDDLNDSDTDGVPDFSDSPAAGRRAALSLSKTPGGLTLTIGAEVGTIWRVEKSSSLTGGWTEATTVPITTDPQSVQLPAPAQTTFWRAVEQGT